MRKDRARAAAIALVTGERPVLLVVGAKWADADPLGAAGVFLVRMIFAERQHIAAKRRVGHAPRRSLPLKASPGVVLFRLPVSEHAWLLHGIVGRC
jgi:hypothetical protein